MVEACTLLLLYACAGGARVHCARGARTRAAELAMAVAAMRQRSSLALDSALPCHTIRTGNAMLVSLAVADDYSSFYSRLLVFSGRRRLLLTQFPGTASSAHPIFKRLLPGRRGRDSRRMPTSAPVEMTGDDVDKIFIRAQQHVRNMGADARDVTMS